MPCEALFVAGSHPSAALRGGGGGWGGHADVCSPVLCIYSATVDAGCQLNATG